MSDADPAKQEHPQLPNTGPFLSVAVLCEKVIQEQGGAVSIIRITDTLNQSSMGPDAPAQMPEFTAEFTMVITLRAGEAKGSFGIKIRPEAPSGFQLQSVEQTVHLAGGPWGASIVAPMQFPISETGVYWFDVILADTATGSEQLLTRVPLEVIYSRQTAG